jgi:hypothetical protein
VSQGLSAPEARLLVAVLLPLLLLLLLHLLLVHNSGASVSNCRQRRALLMVLVMQVEQPALRYWLLVLQPPGELWALLMPLLQPKELLQPRELCGLLLKLLLQ